LIGLAPATVFGAPVIAPAAAFVVGGDAADSAVSPAPCAPAFAATGVFDFFPPAFLAPHPANAATISDPAAATTQTSARSATGCRRDEGASSSTAAVESAVESGCPPVSPM
jgi:hypothetical protein